MKKGLAIFFIFILVFSNVYIAEVNAQLTSSRTDISRITRDFRDPRFDTALGDPRLRTGFDIEGERIVLGPGEEQDLGEDIVINVDRYEPDRIRSSLLEDQDVNIRALLIGFPSNPAITIPQIRDINVRVTNVTTEPKDKKVRVTARYVNPRTGGFGLTTRQYRQEPTYNNLGYILATIGRIPKEEDVPDSITINMDARINFDVSEGLGFGPREDVLVEQTEEEWLKEREQHSFFGGFIRASEVKADRASFIVYDDNLNIITPRAITIQQGRTSGIVLRGGYSRFGNLFNRFRIRVNDIRGIGERAKLYVYRDSTKEFSTRVLTKGSSLYPGSNWILENIRIRKDEKLGEIREVLLRNTKTRDTKLLTLQQIVCEKLPPDKCISYNVCRLEGTTCIQRAKCSELTQDRCNFNPQCSFNQEKNICEQKIIVSQTCGNINGASCLEELYCPTDTKLVGEGGKVGCGKFVYRDAENPDGVELNQICCAPISAEAAKLKEREEIIYNIIRDYGNLAANKDTEDFISKTNDLINNVKTEIFDKETNLETRAKASDLLKSILSDINQLRKKYQDEKNKEKENEVTKIIEELVTFLGQESSLQIPSLEVKAPETVSDLYKLAVQEYENVVRNYPNIRADDNEFYSVKALWKIAQLYYTKLNDETKAIQAYEALLRDPNINDKEKKNIENEIKILKGFLENFGTKPETLKDDEEEIIVKLLDIPTIAKEQEPKATIEIDNIQRVFKVGDPLSGEAEEPFLWKIKSIGESRGFLGFGRGDIVTIERIEIDNQGIRRTREDTITTSLKAIQIGKDKNKVIKARLISTDLKREAHISIMPDAERAISESQFSLHIQIDKRAIKPSIFSDNLDKEINKTKKLIEKVDKLINDMDKIYNFWINFCYVTFGTLWAKNLIQNAFLSNQGIARQKIRDKWVDDYNKARTDPKAPYKGSFDQFVLQNRERYEKELETAQDIVNRIQRGEYEAIKTAEIGEASKDSLKDLFFSREMAAKYKNRYFDAELDAEAKVRIEHIENKFEKLKDKDYDNIDLKKELEGCGLENIGREKYIQNKAGYLNTCITFYKNKAIANYFEVDPKNPPESLTESSLKKVCGFENIKQCPSVVIDAIKRKWDSYRGFQRREYSITDVITEDNVKKIVLGGIGNKLLFKGIKGGICEDDVKDTIDTKKTYYVQDFDGQQCAPIRFGEKPKFTPIKKFSTVRSTELKAERAKGLVEFIAIDAFLYAQVAYTTGNTPKSIAIFERSTPNGPLGTGRLIGNLNDLKEKCRVKDVSKMPYDKGTCNAIDKVEREVTACNTQLSKRLLEAGGICKGYAKEEPQPTEVGQSCIDFMTPTDCALLFNACDPVMCPSSRCNFGGRWYVRNVAQTGIIGSLALCANNFGNPLEGGVAVPVCITGLLGGLRNIKSILQGYVDCLNVQKVKGESIGICDRIRSVYLCDMLWREGIAIFNVKGGILGILSEKIFDIGKGGGEYANFKNAIDNSISGLRFFTQDYAKEVFAAYSGGSLDEIGREICKTAIFGKLPGPGFFDQITRPVSPPQFIAFFDEIPYSQAGGRSESQYSVFHHIYAGANEDIRYSILLRAVNEQGVSYLPIQYVIDRGTRRGIQNVPLAKGSSSQGNNDFVALSGYNEICVEINTVGRTRQRILECGFGKVTTDFGINYLNEKLIERDAQKQINTAEECVPETGRLTTLNYQSGIGISDVAVAVPGAALGSFSTGLLQTGVVRKCSGFDLDVGTGKDDWIAVGVCGKDERDRDLGTCWLYKPGVSKLIQNTETRALIEKGLKETQEKLAKEGIRGLEVLTEEQASAIFNNINNLLTDPNENNFKEIVKLYTKIITGSLIEQFRARAQFGLAEAYEKWAKFREEQLKIVELAKKGEDVEFECETLFLYNKDKGEYTYNDNKCPSTCPNKPDGCFCQLNKKWIFPGEVCGKEDEILEPKDTDLGEKIQIYEAKDMLNIKAVSLEEAPINLYKYVNGEWIIDQEAYLERGITPPIEKEPGIPSVTGKQRELSPEQREKISKLKVGDIIKEEDLTFIFGYRPIIGEDLKILSVSINEGKATAVGVKSGLLYTYDLDSWSIVEPNECIINKVFWDKVEVKDDRVIYLKDKGERVPPIKEGEPVFLHIVSQGKKCLGQDIITRFYSKEINPFSLIPTLYAHPLNINDPRHTPEEDEARTYKTQYGFVTIRAWTSDVKICGNDINSLSNCGKTIIENTRDAIPLIPIDGRNIFVFKIDKGPKDAEGNILESNDLYVEPIKNLEISALPLGEVFTGVDFKIVFNINHPFEYLQDYQIKQETFLNGRKEPPLGGFESAKYSELYSKGFIEEGPYNIQDGVSRKHTIRIPALFSREGELEHKVTITYNYRGKEFKVENSVTIKMVKGECKYEKAYWADEIGGEVKSISRAFEGQQITMIVEAKNCGSKVLYLKIGDANYIPSIGSALREDYTTTIDISLVRDKAEKKWKVTKNVCGGISCEKPPSSLIFYVVENRESLTSDKQSDNYLKVEEIKQYTQFLYYNVDKRVYKSYYFDLDKNLYKLDKFSNIWIKVNEDTNEYINVVNSKEGKETLEKVERIITNR